MGNEEAKGQAIPGSSGLNLSQAKTRRGINWTQILASNGLETPGYKETVDKMRKEGRIKDKKGAD